MVFTCNNCGHEGHVYKNCKEPITSIGIIAFYRDKNSLIKFLSVNRKHSLAFIEFIRGKYMKTKADSHVLNVSYLFILFKNMSIGERHLVQTETFDQLWERWSPSSCKTKYETNRYEYQYSKNKYEQFVNGISVRNVVHTLESVMKQTYSVYTEPEWSFPKGRKNKNETELACAGRECMEETDLDPTKFHILPIDPVYENYTGFNKIKYRNIYYIAEFVSTDPLDYCVSGIMGTNAHNKLQQVEVRNVAWLTLDETIGKIRSYHNKRKCLISDVYNNICIKHYHQDITSPFQMPKIITQHDMDNLADHRRLREWMPNLNIV
jgi:8-oxo-dGTP pyrophosphatase MutT (NUDIX family)